MKCKCCGNVVRGFWKYPPNADVCSRKCLRILVRLGRIDKLNPRFEYPELMISAPKTRSVSIK